MTGLVIRIGPVIIDSAIRAV